MQELDSALPLRESAGEGARFGCYRMLVGFECPAAAALGSRPSVS